MKRNLFLFSIISALLVVFLPGCDNPTGSENPTTPPDTTALQLELNNAQAAKIGVQAVPDGTPSSQIALGIPYVFQAEMDILEDIVIVAEAVRDDSSETQTMVNLTTITLKAAVITFHDSIKTDGTKISGFTRAELITLIDIATDTKDSVPEGVQSSFTPGTAYVPPAAKTAFDTVINYAITVRDNASAGADQVNSAAITLVSAVSAFNSQIKTDGTKNSGYTAAELTVLINTAKAEKAGVETSANGTDISPDTYWVTSAVLTAFDDAIAAAEGADDTNRDVQYKVLEAALTIFSGAKQRGTKTEEEVSGALTVNGLSGRFMVFVVTTAITNSNISSVMNGNSVAMGEADGSPADLEWSPGNGSGTYNVIISSATGGGSVKYQNGVVFANGSGSVNWGSMTEVDFAALSVGTLTFTGGSPGGEWMVFIVSNPITNAWDGLDAMDAYIAVAPGTPGDGDGWMIFTVGAPGGTFNRNGTYAIIYMEGEEGETLKYQNDVFFANGNATVDLSLLIDFDFSEAPIDNDDHTEEQLEELIDSALTEKADVETSANGTDVNSGVYWVTPMVMEEFTTAISRAKESGNIDDRYNALAAAIATFKEAKRYGSKTDSGGSHTVEALSALIAKANEAREGVVTSSNGGTDVSASVQWVDSLTMASLTVAISNALTANPTNLDTRYNALERAIATFNEAKKYGSKNEGGTEPIQKTVTITGLSAYNGLTIAVTLYETEPDFYDWLSRDTPVSGDKEIVQNGSATVDLYSNVSPYGPWTGNGNWYVGFYIERPDDDTVERITSVKKSFSGNNVTVALSEFEVFETPDDPGKDPGGDQPEQPGGDQPGGTDPGGDPGRDPGEDYPWGPGEGGKTVTITGLSAYNDEIMAGLFQTMPDISNLNKTEPLAFGTGNIQGGSVNVFLFNTSSFSPWTGTGNWYVAFMVGNMAYVTQTPKSFSGDNVNVTLSECVWMEIPDDSGGGVVITDPDYPGDDTGGGEQQPGGVGGGDNYYPDLPPSAGGDTGVIVPASPVRSIFRFVR